MALRAAVSQFLALEPPAFHHVTHQARGGVSPDVAADGRPESRPRQVPDLCQPGALEPVGPIPGLDHGGVTDRPAHHGLVDAGHGIDVLLGQLAAGVYFVAKLDHLQRLDADRDLIANAGQPVARADQVEQVRIGRLGGLPQLAGGVDPFDARDVRADLPVVDAIHSVLAVGTGKRTDSGVPDLDVEQQLQALLPKDHSHLTHLQAGLGRYRHGIGIDLEDPAESVHAHDGAGGRRARRERMKAAHRPHRTRVPIDVAQDALQLLHVLRCHHVPGSGHYPAVIVGNGGGHV